MPCLYLLWLGTPLLRHKSKIKAIVEKCFFAVEPHFIFTSLPLLPAIKKDVFLASLLSNLVYNFLYHCDSQYIGCTSQQLQDRICQAVPNFITIASCELARLYVIKCLKHIQK